MDLNTRVKARVVLMLMDGQMDVRTDRKPDPYIEPCLRHVKQKADLYNTDLLLLCCCFTSMVNI